MRPAAGERQRGLGVVIKTLRTISEWLDERHVPQIPGWCTVIKGQYLAATVFALRPRISVEIGVFAGKSLLPIALALKEVDCGRVIGIDPWLPAESTKGYDGANAQWWGNVDHAQLRGQVDFLLKQFGLADVVEIRAVPSDAVTPPDVIDLLHVDGQHTAQAIKDVQRFGSKVRMGGVVFMDDLTWKNEGRAEVGQAVQELLNLGFKELYSILGQGNDFGVFQRIK
jgi:predicted O-methyltransferase YrrM